jgi:hypothetical protein
MLPSCPNFKDYSKNTFGHSQTRMQRSICSTLTAVGDTSGPEPTFITSSVCCVEARQTRFSLQLQNFR